MYHKFHSVSCDLHKQCSLFRLTPCLSANCSDFKIEAPYNWSIQIDWLILKCEWVRFQVACEYMVLHEVLFKNAINRSKSNKNSKALFNFIQYMLQFNNEKWYQAYVHLNFLYIYNNSFRCSHFGDALLNFPLQLSNHLRFM